MTNRSQSSSNIFAMVDIAVSKALLEGAVGKSKITVPLADLVNDGENVRFRDMGEDLALTVQIETFWDTAREETELEFEEREDDNGTR